MKDRTVTNLRGTHAFSNVAATEKRLLAGFQPDGYVRLTSIIRPLGPLPISRSTWWKGVKEGRYPQPIKLGPRITAWRTADIIELVERTGGPVND
ncbi:AlpA family phage regulatory protein [Mesorhizobium sp. CAU 1741]|uniref:helix-turn-helix transcriptional regulator n=1 Tax=Mesorhizobium sp. CAU 1741 TaxID=3140366 RepID=UPI00325B3A55